MDAMHDHQQDLRHELQAVEDNIDDYRRMSDLRGSIDVCQQTRTLLHNVRAPVENHREQILLEGLECALKQVDAAMTEMPNYTSEMIYHNIRTRLQVATTIAAYTIDQMG